MRLQLKKIVLEELIKVDSTDLYQSNLKETLILLKKQPVLYNCCLSGCRFEARRHKDYCKHIKNAHPSLKSITCNFRKTCKRVFSNIETLIDHVKKEHSNVETAGTDLIRKHAAVMEVPCKCDLISCGGKYFENTRQFMTHFNTVHLGDPRECIFANCSKKFPANSESRKHFNIKHKALNHMVLKAQHLLQAPTLAPVLPLADAAAEAASNSCDEADDNDQMYDLFDIDDLENTVPDEESEDYFLHYYCDFLNRLVHHKFIPVKTVQEIFEEYYSSAKKSKEIREQRLRIALQLVPDISVDQVEKIVWDVIGNDIFLAAQEKLSSHWKRSKFVAENICPPSFYHKLTILLE